MKNKFINLLFQEPGFSLKVATVILFVIMSFFLNRGLGLKRIELSKLCQNKLKAQELAKQIPALEEKLKEFEVKGKAVEILKRNVDLFLKGILTKDGESVALINNEMYHKNDMVSGFIITAISSNTVTLQDPLTAEQSKIQLPE